MQRLIMVAIKTFLEPSFQKLISHWIVKISYLKTVLFSLSPHRIWIWIGYTRHEIDLNLKKTHYLCKDNQIDKLHVLHLSSSLASELPPILGTIWPVCVRNNISLSIIRKNKRKKEEEKLSDCLSNWNQTRTELWKWNMLLWIFSLWM